MIEIKHLVMFSSGVCSWVEAKRTVAKYGTDGVVLLFADVKGKSTNPHDGEDTDNYRFLKEAARNVGAPLVTITKGVSIWEHFLKKKMMASNRFPICSVELKREILDAWHKKHTDPATCTLHFGINWDEHHRLDRLRLATAPWRVEALTCESPYLSKTQMMEMVRRSGMCPPKLYSHGFPHANCGGFCVKAGQAQFALLLKSNPARYKYHEDKEQEFRRLVGKDVSIMKDRSGGTTKTLTMKQLRMRIETQQEFDIHEWGGCGCAVDAAHDQRETNRLT